MHTQGVNVAPKPAHAAAGAAAAVASASAASQAASKAVSNSTTSSRMNGSSTSAASYDKHWARIKSYTSRDLERSAIAQKYGCLVERLYHVKSSKKWSAILSGESIGIFDTKEEAIKRTVCAALVMNDTNLSGVEDPLARAKRKRKTQRSSGAGGGASTSHSRSKKSAALTLPYDSGVAPEEFPIGRLDGALPSSMDASATVTLRQPSYGLYDTYCIVCQEEKANIVFEPCLHCVLCSKCVEAGSCKKFCPTCRTTITGRTKPRTARVIRPQVYSVYSFM